MSNRLKLLAFLVLVTGGGLLIGALTIPGPWYQALQKPPFNPPNWLFGPAWTLLYLLIAIAGWRVFVHARSGLLMKVWWLQLVLNFLWSPVFFGLQLIGPAVAVIAALLATILAFIVMAWRVERMAAWLFVPYAAWVAFAATLNLSIWLLN